ncbi:class I SAM-dependent methyltransferase [Mycolicibacterium sp. 624]|uniref:class I SAM-dependent methyltransferase n=1 Tax=Mycolicibacterium sp. 624 TaxID=3156314 RepID=UPI00339600F1
MTGTRMSPGQIAEMVYRAGAAPWDLGEPQPIICQLVALGAVKGNVLDPGCGTGWHAIEYARAGCSVTALDVAPTAVHRARTNARRAGVTVDFRQCDVTNLDAFEGHFDTVVDAKLYDNLDTAEDRLRYASALHRATRPGARLLMYGFGPGEVNGVHNHLLDEPDYETVLPAAGFAITYIGQTTYLLKGFERICAACPQQMPDGPVHIPMTEIHAIRLT